MPLISFNLRNLLLTTAVGATLLLLFVAIGPQGVSPVSAMSEKLEAKSFKNLNLKSSVLPVSSFKGGDVAPGVSIKSDNVNVLETNIFYRLAEPGDSSTPSGKVIFLLHGAAFTSETWEKEIGTIQTMASLGHKVIAVDLPGYGKSSKYDGDRGEFLIKLIKTLSPNVKPILVSPSMSGTFSLPLLNKEPDLICGYIPVAPVATASYSKSFYESLNVPTMIVYGDKDVGLGLSSAKHLSDIPTATAPQILANSRHPAYLDQPEIWHQLIYNFMLYLHC